MNSPWLDARRQAALACFSLSRAWIQIAERAAHRLGSARCAATSALILEWHGALSDNLPAVPPHRDDLIIQLLLVSAWGVALSRAESREGAESSPVFLPRECVSWEDLLRISTDAFESVAKLADAEVHAAAADVLNDWLRQLEGLASTIEPQPLNALRTEYLTLCRGRFDAMDWPFPVLRKHA